MPMMPSTNPAINFPSVSSTWKSSASPPGISSPGSPSTSLTNRPLKSSTATSPCCAERPDTGTTVACSLRRSSKNCSIWLGSYLTSSAFSCKSIYCLRCTCGGTSTAAEIVSACPGSNCLTNSSKFDRSW